MDSENSNINNAQNLHINQPNHYTPRPYYYDYPKTRSFPISLDKKQITNSVVSSIISQSILLSLTFVIGLVIYKNDKKPQILIQKEIVKVQDKGVGTKENIYKLDVFSGEETPAFRDPQEKKDPFKDRTINKTYSQKTKDLVAKTIAEIRQKKDQNHGHHLKQIVAQRYQEHIGEVLSESDVEKGSISGSVFSKKSGYLQSPQKNTKFFKKQQLENIVNKKVFHKKSATTMSIQTKYKDLDEMKKLIISVIQEKEKETKLNLKELITTILQSEQLYKKLKAEQSNIKIHEDMSKNFEEELLSYIEKEIKKEYWYKKTDKNFSQHLNELIDTVINAKKSYDQKQKLDQWYNDEKKEDPFKDFEKQKNKPEQSYKDEKNDLNNTQNIMDDFAGDSVCIKTAQHSPTYAPQQNFFDDTKSENININNNNINDANIDRTDELRQSATNLNKYLKKQNLKNKTKPKIATQQNTEIEQDTNIFYADGLASSRKIINMERINSITESEENKIKNNINLTFAIGSSDSQENANQKPQLKNLDNTNKNNSTEKIHPTEKIDFHKKNSHIHKNDQYNFDEFNKSQYSGISNYAVHNPSQVLFNQTTNESDGN